MGLTKLGLYIEQSDFRNADSLYGADSVVGLSTQKQIINTKADLAGVNLSSYKLMPPKALANYFTPFIFDVVEFQYDELSAGEKGPFQEAINAAFQKDNLSFRLTDRGLVEQLAQHEVLSPEIIMLSEQIKEPGLKELFDLAVENHMQPNLQAHKDAVEKLWDVLERLKTYYTDIDKKKSIEKIVQSKLVFTNEVVSDFVNDLSDQLLQILRDLQEDQSSFQKMGISFEEKAFYDILVKVRDDHGFPYADEKCVVLAKKIKELVDDKAQFADWSTRDDIKNQLNMELTVLLYQNGYPPEWDEEVFEKVMEQAENFKKYAD